MFQESLVSVNIQESTSIIHRAFYVNRAAKQHTKSNRAVAVGAKKTSGSWCMQEMNNCTKMSITSGRPCDVCGGETTIYSNQCYHIIRILSRGMPLSTTVLFVASAILLCVHLGIAIAIAVRKQTVHGSMWWAILCCIEIGVNCTLYGDVAHFWTALSTQTRDSLWMFAILNMLSSLCMLMAVFVMLFWKTKVYFVVLSTACVMFVNLMVLVVLVIQFWIESRQKARILASLEKMKLENQVPMDIDATTTT